MADRVGEVDIRGENISKVVTVFAQKKFKLKPLLINVKSNKWTETYYKEDPTILTAGGTRNIKEIGRFTEFPTLRRAWTKVSADHLKYGGEDYISMEDILTDAIPVQARTIDGMTEGIVNEVDIAIYSAFTGESVTSGRVAAVAEWDAVAAATRDPIQDILKGEQAMMENNYDALAGGVLLVNPHDYRSLMMNSKVINNPSYKTADVVSNGRVGQIVGLNIVVTTSVTDDEAMIIISNKTATWQSVVALTTNVTVEPGMHTRIRSWMVGQIQIHHPLSIYTITGTGS